MKGDGHGRKEKDWSIGRVARQPWEMGLERLDSEVKSF